MGGTHLARIAGFTSTRRGFAFAVTEGPEFLIASGLKLIPQGRAVATEDVLRVLKKARPLFVAIDVSEYLRKRQKGRAFYRCLFAVCRTERILMLDSGRLDRQADAARWKKADVAASVANRFPNLAGSLPRRRMAWQSEDDRVGTFVAIAIAARAWSRFRRPICYLWDDFFRS